MKFTIPLHLSWALDLIHLGFNTKGPREKKVIGLNDINVLGKGSMGLLKMMSDPGPYHVYNIYLIFFFKGINLLIHVSNTIDKNTKSKV